MKTWGIALAVVGCGACVEPATVDGGPFDANLPTTTLRADFGLWEGEPPALVASGPVEASWPEGWVVSCRRGTWDGETVLWILADRTDARVDLGNLRIAGDSLQAVPGSSMVTVWSGDVRVTGHVAEGPTNECFVSGNIVDNTATVRASCVVIDGAARSYIGSADAFDGRAVIVAENCD